MWSRGVYSSNVSEVGYDPETQELFITWKSGKRSVYADVPEQLADQVSKAPSVGQAVNSEIKPNFSHRYG